jgi:hypothetical protein
MMRSRNRRIVVQAGLGKWQDPISGIKRAGSMAQAVESFLAKHEALSSKP